MLSTRPLLATCAALCAFAANSLLCRLALRAGLIDAPSFTALRLVSGALLLGALGAVRLSALREPRAWLCALALFLYAAPFSFAYLELGAGTGALLLFAAVQITMVGWGLLSGERPQPGFWLGMPLAVGGLLGLTLPGASAPNLLGALLMGCAGVAWGAYSLLGRTTRSAPLQTTANSFLASSLLGLALLASCHLTRGVHASWQGAALACASGALASGLGYAIWYYALRSLAASSAAMLQLLVPLLTATAGALWLDEKVSLRLIGSGSAILLGVALERGLWARLTRRRP